MLDIEELGAGISCIDTGYVRAKMTACYLLQQDDRAAFIETGVNNNVEGMLALLDEKGIPRQHVDYVIPTHVHLDHAGGAGQLMQALPNAQLVIHPHGARHMIDPSRLIAGASAVYGEKQFADLYGDIKSIDADRVIEATDGFSLELGTRVLQFIDTPGHARHHFCVYDESSQGIFSGDTLGLSYRELDSGGRVFCFPTTTPVQFDPDALHQSIDRLMALQPKRIYLTHYGCIEALNDLAVQLHGDIDSFVQIAKESAGQNDVVQFIASQLEGYLVDRIASPDSEISIRDIKRLLEVDIHLNAQGLAHWLSTSSSV